MTAKKLFVPVLSAVFLASSVGLAAAQAKPEPAAQEKKGAEESKKVAEPTPGKAVGKSKNANGMVKAATADSLTVVGKDKKEWTFAVDTKTSIKKAGKAVVATDLKEGDPVHVLFSDADGKLVAKAVTVKAGGTAKKEEKMEKK
ncbi:MAG: hypothetical protein XU13_C0069G0013 [Candidatus Rokubacteria bacterium CSP1-6]|nr:MAG: hypothetical protein XU13_C0069G0013 [Candidatus Rokubacteria bacterium CSP1-6]